MERNDSLDTLFLALSDPTRLRLLSLMGAGEVSVSFLADETGESQPKISRHLAYLRDCGVVETRRDGKWIYYRIAEQRNRTSDRILKMIVAEISGVATFLTPPSESPEEPADQFEVRSRESELEVFLL
jgi:DNA-binding transcriptional ArsR family regulator